MATQGTDSLDGSKQLYKVSQNVKRYTLRDNAFKESKSGKFTYERVLSSNIHDKTSPKLRVMISDDFSNLKISTVNAKGLKKVNLYQTKQYEESKKFAEFLLNNLVEEGVLEKA